MLMRPVTLQNLHWQFGMSPRSWAHITNPRRVWSLQPNKQQYANDNEDSSATSVFLSRWTTLPKTLKAAITIAVGKHQLVVYAHTLQLKGKLIKSKWEQFLLIFVSY